MNVNPVHFFNERGHSILSADHLERENDKLRGEIEELKRRNRSLTLRLQTIADRDEPTLNS